MRFVPLLRVSLVTLWAASLFAGCSGEERPEQRRDSGGSSDVDTMDVSDAGDLEETAVRDSEPSERDIQDTAEVSEPAPEVSIGTVRAVANPSNALSYFVEWTTDTAVETDLHVDCGPDWKYRYSSEEKRTDHSVFVMGLWEGADCTFTATAQPPGYAESMGSTEVQVGPLPNFLPALTVKKRVEADLQPGWTMFNLSNRAANVPLIVAMVDSRGRYRWYHQLSVSFSGSDTEVRPAGDSIFIGKTGSGPRELDWEGNVVWKGSFGSHHEIRPSHNGEVIEVLRHKDNCTRQPGSDGVFRYSRKKQKFVGSWHLCDYWYPSSGSVGPDWSHLNTIEPVPGEKAWILSSRNQHTLFKIDYGNDKLDWKMGHRGDFGLSGSEKFYRQHAPEILQNGNILLFDNGSSNFNREWSRALEISYDTQNMTANVVWSYRPTPDVFAPIWGDADRQANGNTLITFGIRNPDPNRRSQLMEVTPKKKRVWHLQAPNKWGWYRSDRIVAPPKGYVRESQK